MRHRLGYPALIAAFFAGLVPASAVGQPQTILFPGQSGDELRASLRAAYRPATLTGDNDDLYSVIDRTNVGGQDGVVCVYTGFFVPFDCVPNCDPSQDVFNSGAGINQEHTWPQSQLNGSGSAVAESDLNHIFPTRVDVNAHRANAPFAEIPDGQTNHWYRDASSQTTIPTSGIDEFSELLGSMSNAISFEPREVHEGNVARALFYVQTMYDEETGDAWFTPQRRTLYDWSYIDPIDQAEYDRTFRIAPFQSNQPNPFILDSTLIRRAFFPEIVVSTEPAADDRSSRLSVWPGVIRDAATVTLVPAVSGRAVVDVLDALGRRVARLYDGPATAGVAVTLRMSADGLAPGVLLVRSSVGGSVRVARAVVR
jgi:hypothetical protein